MELSCSVCNVLKPLDDFNFSKRTENTRQTKCRECCARYNKARYARDKTRIQAINKKWYLANKVKVSTWFREVWYPANQERVHQQNAQWKLDNRQQHLTLNRAYAQRRRARMEQLPATLTQAEWEDILLTFNHCCAYCLQPFAYLEQDHMQAVSRGGGYTKENIIPACRGCNARKNNKSLLEFARFQ